MLQAYVLPSLHTTIHATSGLVPRFADVRAALGDWETFSSAVPGAPKGRCCSTTLRSTTR